MQNNQTIATHKIVIFLVFVCAAIMTSLFVFHLRHQAAPSSLSADEGLLFSAPRTIKPFDLVAANNTKFSQKDFFNHWTLLFFGFTHCASVCPTTLTMLNQAYNELQPAYPNLQVVLISLDPERDTLASLAQYTHSFNPNFIGVTGKIQELRKLQSQLGVFSARDNTTTGSDYQLQHTPSIMLIDPHGRWAGMLNFGMNSKQMVHALDNSIRFLTRV